MKKIDKDPFSNGTESAVFEYQCCDKCIKSSQMRKDGTFTNVDKNNMPNRCSIQRDIITRMLCNDPINEQTIKICHDFIIKGILCPYMKTKRKKNAKNNKMQLSFTLQEEGGEE